MKKLNKYIGIIIISTFVLLTNALVVSAHSGHDKPIDDIVAEILAAQDASSVDTIDCDKITDSRLEELGEAAMSIMHPDEQQHEIMDEMMGGEGSDSLKARHIIMGQNYLGCSSINSVDSMMGGGSGMMGDLDNHRDSWAGENFDHMGSYTNNPILMLLASLFLILGSAAFIKIILNKK